MTSIGSQGRSVAVAAIMSMLLGILVVVGSAFADTQIASKGSGADQVLAPAALDVDPASGDLYVADRGNRRIDVFASGGDFLRAFGWGVVASGPGNDPQNEIQEVEVSATSGSFSLLFIQNSEVTVGPIKQETGLIAFDAPAAAVEAALEGLASIGPDDVTVTGSAGGPWSIEFTGALADTDLHQLEEGGASELSGGAAELIISTPQEGGNYEVCEPADVCRAGQLGVQAGQMKPASVAVDPPTGDIYVFDGLETASHNEPPNNRVQKFTSEGDFIYMLGGGVNVDTDADLCTAASGDTCGRGSKGTAAGEFNSAVSSVDVGPGDVLYVNDGDRVQKFDASGAFLGEVALPGASPRFLAVDSGGNIYVATLSEVRKYSPTGTQLFALPLSNVNAIAVDGSDRLYVSSLESGEYGISRFSSSGSPEAVFYSVTGFRAFAIAPDKEATGVYTIEDEPITELQTVNLIPVPPPGPVVYPKDTSVFAGPIGNVKATLHSRINPEGKATTFHFEYVEQESFEAEGGWSSPKVESTPESSSVGSDFNLHSATDEVTGLTPETEYRFRVVATNPDGETEGPDGTFETEPPVKFGPLWVSEVKGDSAVLNAEVNPFGFAAKGHFEYVDDATYQSSGFASATKTPAGTPIDFGAGEEFVEGSAPATPLLPDTIYHYRLVITNNCKPDEPAVVCTFTSEEQTFQTFGGPEPPACPNDEFRNGAARSLLDCRAYEMVTPIDKNGVNVEVVFSITGYRAELNQSALDGGKISYSAYRASGDPESAPYTSQYLAERTGDGWEADPIAPPREGPSYFNSAGLDYQFKAFTEDLCLSWPLQDTPLLLAPDAIAGYPNLYRRDNCEPGEGSYDAITEAAPIGNPDPSLFYPELGDFSTDGSKAFFSVPAKLTSNSRQSIPQTYEVSAGGVKPVCVLPAGNVTLSGCALGTGTTFAAERNNNTATAVSEDGSVAYWTDNPTQIGPLYVRINAQETALVSAQPSQFWMASADGSKAIYSVGDKLFEFNLSTRSSTLIAEGSRGLAGASEDLSQVYLGSTKVLAPGATAGETNLYRYSGGSFQFIGTLASSDVLTNRPSPLAIRPYLHTARVTPDGNRLVFMSRASLTGYDNTDAVTGDPAAEIFLYDATADGGAGELLCISCNPSGARPTGREWEVPANTGGWVAAWIPGWTTQMYASRVISDDGTRVFFNSFDALVARDTNGEQDVYQWEAPGAGNCEVGGYSYAASAGGCVNLISTGQSPDGSEFVDASASGNDVFFKTYSSLVPQDPALVDIYDARVGGGFPPPPSPQPECEGEACLPPPPPAPGHPTPQSQTFVGPGNPVFKSNKRKKCPKGKHRVKRKGKVICVKNKKSKKSKNRKKNKSRRAGK